MVVACHLGGRLVHRMAIVRLMSKQVDKNATERRNWRAVRTAMNATYGMVCPSLLFHKLLTNEFVTGTGTSNGHLCYRILEST